MHCMVMNKLGTDQWRTFTDPGSVIHKIVNSGFTFVCHNQLGHDLKLIRKLYGVDYYIGPDTWGSTPCQFIDTLVMSRELWPDRPGGHGLEAWAKRVQTFKPEIQNWDDLPVEVYVDRCENDVKTNIRVFEELMKEAGL